MINVKRYTTVKLDRQAVYLAILFAVVQVAAIALALGAQSQGASPSTPGNVEGTTAGASWVILEVAWAFLVIGLIFAWRYLPEWLQSHVKTSLKFAALLFVGAYLSAKGIWLVGLASFIGLYTVYKFVNVGGVWWLVNNAMSVSLAIYAAAWVGLALDVWALLLALLGFTLYDRLFADKKEWMMSMASVFVKYRLPVLFIKPDKLRFEWSELMDDEGLAESESAWGIGTADLFLPAAFTCAIVTSAAPFAMLTASIVTLGILVATLRIRHKMLEHGSGAGLPPLTAGAVGAYVAILAPIALYNGVIA